MKIEHYKLSKPYKPFVLVVDGQDLVLSIFSFYWRFKGLKSGKLRSTHPLTEKDLKIDES